MRYDQTFATPNFHSALLTTFSFDPTVFENVVLVAMRSRGCRNIGLLTDENMMNRAMADLSSLSGLTRVRAGRDYHIVKRKVPGAFHPKMTLQLGEYSGRLMVGSANLTGAGIARNFESVATLNYSNETPQTAPLFLMALEYFKYHTPVDDEAMWEIIKRAEDKTPWLKDIIPASQCWINNHEIHLLTELDPKGIGNAFVSFTEGDSIKQLIIVSPYTDHDLAAVNQLRAALGAPKTSLIVDENEQDFSFDLVNRLGTVSVHPAQRHKLGSDRRLHAKMLIAIGDKADYVLSGSANASMPALFSQPTNGNAEMCIMRTEEANTALDKYGLKDCFACNMSEGKLRSRQSFSHARDELQLIDGGSCWIEYETLLWRPATAIDPSQIRIVVHLVDGSTTTLQPVENRSMVWEIPLANVSDATFIVVQFSEKLSSAPVVVTNLRELQRRSRPKNSGAAERILLQFESRDHVDYEDYERVLKLIALSAQRSVKQKDFVRIARAGEEKIDGEILSESDFGRISKTADGMDALKFGAVSQARNSINSYLGLVQNRPENEDSIDPISELIQGKRTKKSNIRAQSDRQKHTNGNAVTMKSALASADKLISRVNETCITLSKGEVSLLEIETSIRLHLLINIFLSHCSRCGEKSSARFPISANEPKRSWIRILGRLMVLIEDQLNSIMQTDGPPDNLEPEIVEALASYNACCEYLLSAARSENVSPAIVSKLEMVKQSIARNTHVIAKEKLEAQTWLEETVKRLLLRYASQDK